MTLYDKIIALYPALTADDFMTHIALQNDGDGDYIAQWDHPIHPRPSDEQLAAATPSLPKPPSSVTMRQARLALLQFGLLQAVNAALETMPGTVGEAARIEWEYAATVERHSPLVMNLAAALSLTEPQLDELFAFGATL